MLEKSSNVENKCGKSRKAIKLCGKKEYFPSEVDENAKDVSKSLVVVQFERRPLSELRLLERTSTLKKSGELDNLKREAT